MTTPVVKRYLQPDEIHDLSLQLAQRIQRDDFVPDFIIALWRGGAAIGCYVQGYLAWCGHKSDHVAIRTSSRDETMQQHGINIHSIDHLTRRINSHHNILIIDDVFDSGRTIDAFIAKMKDELRANFPLDEEKQVRVATLFFKPKRNKTHRKPNWSVVETDDWLVFPHELEDLSREEIEQHYPQAARYLPTKEEVDK